MRSGSLSRSSLRRDARDRLFNEAVYECLVLPIAKLIQYAANGAVDPAVVLNIKRYVRRHYQQSTRSVVERRLWRRLHIALRSGVDLGLFSITPERARPATVARIVSRQLGNAAARDSLSPAAQATLLREHAFFPVIPKELCARRFTERCQHSICAALSAILNDTGSVLLIRILVEEVFEHTFKLLGRQLHPDEQPDGLPARPKEPREVPRISSAPLQGMMASRSAEDTRADARPVEIIWKELVLRCLELDGGRALFRLQRHVTTQLCKRDEHELATRPCTCGKPASDKQAHCRCKRAIETRWSERRTYTLWVFAAIVQLAARQCSGAAAGPDVPSGREIAEQLGLKSATVARYLKDLADIITNLSMSMTCYATFDVQAGVVRTRR